MLTAARKLELLNEHKVCNCDRCPELVEYRTQTVLGDGNPDADLLFLGEAPGRDEDKAGIPFVGRAGKLLDNVFAYYGWTRERDVYICNILKCRPPSNRNPLPEEVKNCQGYLEVQIQTVNPKWIVCLGAVAAQNLLNVETPIGKLRGEVYDYNGAKVICTYHPAYLLRNPKAKAYLSQDMELLKKEMNGQFD